ncbi:MAG: endolytic transglycosylase MltG [Deltaproteobacteria bacterium]|nr:endolytic transglycosylase MltG [Deltaproteobacteria bacterium]
MSRKALVITAAVLAVCLGIAAWLVLDARAKRIVVTLLPGRSIWEVADQLEKQRPGTREEVLRLAADKAFALELGLPVHAREPRSDGVVDTWLEGFVFPETYHFPPDVSAHDVLERAAAQFNEVFGSLTLSHTAALATLRDELGLEPSDVVILASLVEEETGRRDEAARVAGVFLNRLRKGMRLETDPTLMYRPDRVGKRPTPAERKDATNPYNTYAIRGLPPGPICSPTRAALLAVLEAEQHDFLFFVAKRDGTGGSAFAATLVEHEANIDRYLKKR